MKRGGLTSFLRLVRGQGALIALALLILFGGLRYDRFLSAYNIQSFLSFNSMFALVSLGMVFVIITGGVDLSVGSVAALASVVAALLSPYGLWPALGGAVLAATLIGLFNGLAIALLKIPFFITTLATLLGARGLALILANNQSVSVSYATDFVNLGQNDFLGVPIPVWIAGAAFVVGMVVLGHTQFGRRVLAVGGNEEASRLMGLRVDRILIVVYTLSGRFGGSGRGDFGGAVRGGATARGPGLGTFGHRFGRGRRHAADRRQRHGGRDACRGAAAGPHLQPAQLRKRARRDFAERVLAVGHSWAVFARGHLASNEVDENGRKGGT